MTTFNALQFNNMQATPLGRMEKRQTEIEEAWKMIY
jgi:hypothetical protein